MSLATVLMADIAIATAKCPANFEVIVLMPQCTMNELAQGEALLTMFAGKPVYLTPTVSCGKYVVAVRPPRRSRSDT